MRRMFRGARVAVVMPAYDESRLIARALGSVPAWIDRVVVVDDASTDDTALRAEAFGDPRVVVVRHARNRGVGAAIATGYAVAFGEGYDIAVVMAGDAQMDPEDLPSLVEPIVEGRADYAKGDRLSWPGARRDMPAARFVGNHVLSLLTRWTTGLGVRDSQCGYTALAYQAARRLELERLWPRYGYPNDLLGHLAQLGARVADVSVRPVYRDEVSGIGWWHALVVIPFVLLRVLLRRMLVVTPSRAGSAESDSELVRATGR